MSSRKIYPDERSVVQRYPVKSMRGESLAATTLTLQGVLADRRYEFVQTASRSSFPLLAAGELLSCILPE